MQNHHNVVIVVTDENCSFFNNDLMHNSTEKIQITIISFLY